VAREKTWKEAIEVVLRDAGAAMHYRDIADQIIARGLRKNVGATPASTVNANLVTSIHELGEKSPFLKTGRGEYILRTGMSRATREPNISPIEETEEQYEIITSFGMFWRREAVHWATTPRLLGVQQLGAEPVDFNKQQGIYLLYDVREVIYVGRATDRPLGRRLYEHTLDRLSTRWDRFSWFGLVSVSDTGALNAMPPNYRSDQLIPALEAILIESLEPRQNRKRGDDLSAVEYLQYEDPQVKSKRIKDALDSVLDKK
jgi:hypothetical protein